MKGKPPIEKITIKINGKLYYALNGREWREYPSHPTLRNVGQWWQHHTGRELKTIYWLGAPRSTLYVGMSQLI